MLNSEVTRAFLTWYVPDLDFSDPASLPTDLAPANAESLAGLPPAYIGTAGHDPLRDDGAKYAEITITAAGIPVTYSNEPTMVHGSSASRWCNRRPMRPPTAARPPSRRPCTPEVVMTDPVAPDYQTLIVGAGFSGIGAAIQLDKAGLRRLPDRRGRREPGGTWYWNTYPGIAVDIPSFSYQFSFEQSRTGPAPTRRAASSRATPTAASRSTGCATRSGSTPR